MRCGKERRKRICPVKAITGGKNIIHIIDQEKCTKCGACLEVCPTRFDAIAKLSGVKVPEPVPQGAEVIRKRGGESD